jgi:hypothetical protein
MLGLVFQGADAPLFSWYHYLIGFFLVVAAVALGYYVSKFLAGRRYRKEQKVERKRMFDIEKALKDFWEHERGKLSAENERLSEKIELLGKQVEEYRKKAAGVGIMGLSKDRRTDMLMQLMLENEALEEKLYELNLKMKDERDEYLSRELQNISYKRILLSEILKEKGVQDKIRDILKDDSKLTKMELPAGARPAGTEDDTSGEAPEEEADASAADAEDEEEGG